MNILKRIEKSELEMDTGLKSAIRKAYKNSAQGKVAMALAEISRWQRKETIARTKLAEARKKLSNLTMDIARKVDERGTLYEQDAPENRKGDNDTGV
jgi:uncharacterized protein YgbK (DUF1537 family)